MHVWLINSYLANEAYRQEHLFFSQVVLHNENINLKDSYA